MKRRLRKTVKWTLTVMAVLTLVAWMGSRWVWIGYTLIRNGHEWSVGVDSGAFYIQHLDYTHWHSEQGWTVMTISDSPFRWSFRYLPYKIVIPHWFPFLLLGAPAAWLWWRGNRRFPETACQFCGYDISGAPHERCPECGKEI